jgi:peroxiredoxin
MIKIKKIHFYLVAGLAVGVAIGLFAAPYAKSAYKYFSLKGYSRLDDYKKKSKVQGVIPNFTLLNAEGQAQELYRLNDARAVVFISHSAKCKACERYGYVVSGLKKEYETRGVRLFYLNSSPDDTREQVLASSRRYPVRIPFLLDPSQVVAKALGLANVPEAVVLDPRNWSVVFRGPIDDQVFEGKRDKPESYLRNSLEEFLHDKPISFRPLTKEYSPLPFKKFETSPTYVTDAGPVIAKKCLTCHSEFSGTKPFFNNFKMVRAWTAMIKETLLTRRMPPWTWDVHLPQPYQFSESLTLSPPEMRMLIEWIDAGAPRGEGKDPLIWAARAWSAYKTKIPKADYYASNQEILVPPKGYNEYKFYQIDGPTKEDMWVVGTSLTSTNIKTIHHQMLIVTDKPLSFYTEASAGRRDEELVNEDNDGGIPAWELHQMRMDNVMNDRFIRIQIYGLGLSQPTLLKPLWGDNLGFFIPKGSNLILETHYHGTGKPEKEISTVGLYLQKGPHKMTKINSGKVSFINQIELAPGAKSTVIDADPVILHRKSGLLALGLHMHMRGTSAKYFATYPDGKVELIASHPIFNYTTSTARGIVYNTKKIFPAGTQIHIQCTFDNSINNPFNPDPTRHIGWGQTIDRSEMCMGYLWTYDVPEKGETPVDVQSEVSKGYSY